MEVATRTTSPAEVEAQPAPAEEAQRFDFGEVRHGPSTAVAAAAATYSSARAAFSTTSAEDKQEAIVKRAREDSDTKREDASGTASNKRVVGAEQPIPGATPVDWYDRPLLPADLTPFERSMVSDKHGLALPRGFDQAKALNDELARGKGLTSLRSVAEHFPRDASKPSAGESSRVTADKERIG